MTRKKMKLAWIVHDSARKASLKKRRAGLLQKVRELSILCDVGATIIIYSPNDSEPMMWPSRTNVQEILARFNSMSEMERIKKMINLETYINQSINKLRETFNKHQMKVREMEVSVLMHHVYQGNGLDGLGVMEMQSLIWFAQEKRKEIQMRLEHQQTPITLGSLPFAPPLHSPLAPASTQPSGLILDQLTTNVADNIDGSNLDHQEKSPKESAHIGQWFNDMMNNTNNMVGSSRRAKADQMISLSAYDKLFGSSDMPMLVTLPPLPPHVGGSNDRCKSMGIHLYDEGSKGLQGVNMNFPPSDFEGNDGGNDISLGLQPYEKVKTSGNVSSGDMRLPSELFGGNVAASDDGLPNDVSKQPPTNFYP